MLPDLIQMPSPGPKTSRLANLLVAAVAVVLTLAALELVYRHLLFGPYAFLAPLRDPLLYADGDCSDAYWLLRVRFGAAPGPRNDPLLGHVKPDIAPGVYTHRQAAHLNGRRPVLLYGDSFAGCATGPADCFEGLCNADPRFARDHYLINYGVGSYGLDQIYLLYRESVGHYDHPIVIFSFLDGDLDRCVLSLREGQKPYFALKDGRLELKGLPIDMDSQAYFRRRPPDLTSYVLRLAAFRLFRGHLDANAPFSPTRQAKQELTRALLTEVAADLERRGLRHVFFVFEGLHRPWQRPLNWRLSFLQTWFQASGQPHIWARQALEEAVPQADYRWPEYVVSPRDHHPNRRANEIFTARLLAWLWEGRTD